jgi:hypothetical protein
VIGENQSSAKFCTKAQTKLEIERGEGLERYTFVMISILLWNLFLFYTVGELPFMTKAIEFLQTEDEVPQTLTL